MSFVALTGKTAHFIILSEQDRDEYQFAKRPVLGLDNYDWVYQGVGGGSIGIAEPASAFGTGWQKDDGLTVPRVRDLFGQDPVGTWAEELAGRLDGKATFEVVLTGVTEGGEEIVVSDAEVNERTPDHRPPPFA